VVIGITSRPTFDPVRSDTLELARHMRQNRTFTLMTPMHKHTVGQSRAGSRQGAASYATLVGERTQSRLMLCCETLTAYQLRRTGQVDLARYVSPAGVA
jgi:hypothetical protein